MAGSGVKRQGTEEDGNGRARKQRKSGEGGDEDGMTDSDDDKQKMLVVDNDDEAGASGEDGLDEGEFDEGDDGHVREEEAVAPAAKPEEVVVAADEDDLDSENDNNDYSDSDSDGGFDPGTASGKVKKIECRDFMCHKHLHVDFCKDINFITGPNGSGKSAVIAALQICLGMSAKTTQRGNNMKGLIRHGSHGDAVVRVYLYNDDPEPISFMPEDYGKVLMIERVIKRTGGSEFRMYNAESSPPKIVSKQRGMVEKAVRHFNIVIDNPCCILDQETSKQFLKGNATKKYEVFLSASNLEVMTQCYEEEAEKRAAAMEALKQRKEQIRSLKRIYKQKEEAVKELTREERLHEELRTREEQSTWVLVRDRELEVQELKVLVANEQAMVEKCKMESDAAEALAAADNSKSDEVNARFKELEGELQELREGIRELNTRLDTLRKKERGIKKRKLRSANDIEQMTKARDKKKQQLEEILEKAQSGDSQHAQQLKEMSEQVANTEEEIKKLRGDEEEASSRMPALEEDVEEKDNKFQERRRAVELVHQSVVNCKQQLQDLKRSKTDPAAAYGQGTIVMLRMIEENKSLFSRVPVHVGMQVKLRDLKWQKPVQHHLRSQLQSFLVHDNRDFNKLKDLAKRAKCRVPNCIITKFTDRRYEIDPQKRFRSEYDDIKSFEDVLEIENPNVFNALVDQAQINGSALAPDTRRARFAAFEARPAGLKRCYNLDADCFSLRAGNAEYKQAYRPPRGANISFFSTDTRAQEEQCQGALARAEKEYGETLALSKAAQGELRTANKALKTVKDQVEALRTQQVHLRKNLRASKDAYHKLADHDPDQQLNAERQAAELSIEQYNINLEETSVRLQEVSAELEHVAKEVEPLQLEAHQRKDEERQIIESMNEQLAMVNEMQQALQQVVNKSNRAKKKLFARQNALTQLEENLQTKTEEATKAREGALDYCGNREIDPGNLSIKEVTTMIKGLTQDIETERKKRRESSDRSFEELFMVAKREAKRAKEKWIASREISKKQEAYLKQFELSNRLRKGGWETLKKDCQRRMKRIFQSNLSHRQYRGDVVFDDQEKKLDFLWSKSGNEPTQTQIDDEEYYSEDEENPADVTDTGTLSGGEKSFTTLSFLIAMGELIRSPFRVMDEFDVFMDNTNRKQSLELLLQNSETSKSLGRQFIFITPHDISQVPTHTRTLKRTVKKIKMRPAARDFGSAGEQTELQFTAA
ncbi:Structural maintenance of chromosomes protein 6 (SMC protein 6) (SMC-6) (mSMC6) [Durusdinium trenchii]|uniref:Structural maintenance of chromosomes protein 6 (SMC protein 6) (SMC-6) (MSMC6) n=1 Tax=Durusdinium trenchii TaxID=1381693 RepID=A0ABP0J2S7_9DINO